MSNQAALQAHILERSVASEFTEACAEWTPTIIEKWTDGTHCPCGKFIKTVCFIQNKLNDNRTFVGSECLSLFRGGFWNSLITGMKAMWALSSVKPNMSVVEYAFGNGWIDEDEYDLLEELDRRRVVPIWEVDRVNEIMFRIRDKSIRDGGTNGDPND